MMPQRQRGAVLLMVSIVLATVAALAVAVNQLASVESRSTHGDYEGRAATYLADAGVAAARWTNQVAGCTSRTIAPTALGSGTFSADVPAVPGKAKTLDIIATGAVTGGIARTLQRKQVTLSDLSKIESVRLTNNARDITIDVLQSESDDDDERLWLRFEGAHALLFWGMNDIKTDAKVLSATLTLTPYGSNGTGGTVAVQRVTTRWDDNATWSRPREEVTRWNGGNYVDQPAAVATVAGSATSEWDLTDLVDGWFTGQLPNYGILLRLAKPAPTVIFHSLDASSSRRPALQVLFARRC